MKYFLWFAIFLHSSFVGAEATRSVPPWVEEVERFVAEGNAPQALLTAKEALRLDPENPRAKELIERLSQPITDNQDQKKWERGEILWQEALAYRRQGQSISAFLKLREAKRLLQQNLARPPYFSELEGMYAALEGSLQQDLEIQLKKMESSADPVVSGKSLQKILSWYPDYEPAKKAWEKVVVRLNQRSREAWMRAETLRQLEGCEAAFAALQRAKTLAYFEEVSVWQQADQAIRGCQMGKN